jgi:hypothetical protein
VAGGLAASAVGVAAQLPEATGTALLGVAREAFVTRLHLTSAAAAVIAAVIAITAAVALEQPAQLARTRHSNADDPPVGPGRMSDSPDIEEKVLSPCSGAVCETG